MKQAWTRGHRWLQRRESGVFERKKNKAKKKNDSPVGPLKDGGDGGDVMSSAGDSGESSSSIRGFFRWKPRVVAFLWKPFLYDILKKRRTRPLFFERYAMRKHICNGV